MFPLLLCAACQPENGRLPGADFDPTVRTRDPVILLSLLANADLPDPARVNADIILTEVRPQNNGQRLALLHQIVVTSRNSDFMRIYALNQLEDADPALGQRILINSLPEMEGDLLEAACQNAANLHNTAANEALILSLARGAELAHVRPEWQALTGLQQQSAAAATDILFDRLQSSAQISVRQAALDILPYVTSPDTVKSRIIQFPAIQDAWLNDLRWWVQIFDSLPAGNLDMATVQFLHEPDNQALAARATTAHEQLKDAADYRASPRFVCALAYCSPETISLSRPALFSQLKRRLDALPHRERDPAITGSPAVIDSTLVRRDPDLSRGDLLSIHLLLNALDDPATLQEFYRQGMRDLADTTTEHGGLLVLRSFDHPTLDIMPYPALIATSDLQYIPSNDLFRDTPKSLAQYHFHFQQIHNEGRAGPGEGDLNYARHFRVNCVVITSTNDHEINLDYYTPKGAVVDLGVYHVP